MSSGKNPGFAFVNINLEFISLISVYNMKYISLVGADIIVKGKTAGFVNFCKYCKYFKLLTMISTKKIIVKKTMKKHVN